MASRVERASAVRRLGICRSGASLLRFWGGALFCLLAFSAGNPARALIVGPGDSLEVTFAFATVPDAGGMTIDLLALTTTPFSASAPNIAVAAQLYDGAALLGSGLRPSAALVSFSDGLFTNAITALLDPVRDGSIAGRVVFTPIFPGDVGFINFDTANFRVRAGHGTSGSGALLATPDAAISSVRVPVAATPAPAALLLFVSALAALSFVFYRRRAPGSIFDRMGSPDRS